MGFLVPRSETEEFKALKAHAGALMRNVAERAPPSDLADKVWALLPYFLDAGEQTSAMPHYGGV